MSLSYLNVAPIGFTRDGRSIWPFTGGDDDRSGTGSEGDNGANGDDDGDGGDPDPDSTEGLKRALEAERAENKRKSDALRGYRVLQRESGAKNFSEFKARVTGGSGTDGSNSGKEQIDIEAIRKEIRGEVEREIGATSSRKIALARIEALASTTFLTPKDAVMALRDDVDEMISDDGEPDEKAIKRALSRLLSERPHWKKSDKGSEPSFDGGARGAAPAASGFSQILREESRQKRYGK